MFFAWITRRSVTDVFADLKFQSALGAVGLRSTCLRRPSAGKVDKARELRGGNSMNRRAEACRKESA
jgi:hypothetical protein